LILTDGAQLTLTPTFYVYEMFRDHQGAQSLRTDLSNAAQITNGQLSRPALSASASRAKNSVLISLANQNPNDGAELRISLRGARATSATASTLTGPNVRSQNTVQEPQIVSPKPGQVRIDGDDLVAILPAGSVQAVRVQLG
jgi:alpha-N-arabinofuranosidase